MKDNAPYAVAVGYLARKMDHKPAEATAFLKKWTLASTAGSWHNSLFRFLGGALTAPQFLAASADDDRLNEARSFIGAMAILDGTPAIAKTQMDRLKTAGAKSSFPYSFLTVLDKNGAPPAPLSVHYTQGVEHFNEGRNAEAIASFTKAITADPKRPEYFAARAKANIALRKIPAAQPDLEKAITLGGTYDAYLLRANLHIENGSYDKALSDLETGTKFLKPVKNEEDPVTRHEATLAGVYALLGKASAFKPTGDEETVSYYYYNRLYQHALDEKAVGNYGLAIAKVTAGDNYFSDKTEFLAERGLLRILLGDPAAALADYDKVLAADRRMTYIHVYRGEAFLLMKRCADAIKAADTVLASRGDDIVHPQAYAVRAAANCALGNKAEAGIDEAEAKILGGEIKTPCR